MSEVTGKYMLSAITRAVAREFGDKIPVHNETAMQDAELPYLFVSQIQMGQKADTPRRFNRPYLFDVRYHPNDKQGSRNAIAADVAARLFSCLWMIETADQPVRARSIRSETEDGVTHVIAEYVLRVMLRLPDDPRMQTLDIEETIPKGEK